MTSVAAARLLLLALLSHGMRDLVICPGSRSGPLAYAAFEAAKAGSLRVHVRADERAAAFVALGIARSSRRRAVGIAMTSGTAVGNVHPAVLEADAARLPLVVLSADRPARLQHVRANQTCDQEGIFGRAVRGWWQVDAGGSAPLQPEVVRLAAGRAMAAALGEEGPDGGPASRFPGPVQINCRFDEPLVPGDLDTTWARDIPQAPAPHDPGPEPVVVEHGPRTVVVAGDDAGPQAAQLAQAAGWPLLAEPSSGARYGTCAVQCHRIVAAGPLGAQVERAIVFGHPTLHRSVQALLARAHTIVVEPTGGPWFDAGAVANQVVPALTISSRGGQDGWLAAWHEHDAVVRRGLEAMADSAPHLTGMHVARAVGRWADAVFLGASNPIRDFDLAALPDQGRTVWAGRGLAGIDGCISTAAGLALGTGRPVCALVGDLTFLHDAGGLFLPRGEEEPNVRVVVAADGGGSIFAGLEHGQPARAAAFGRMFAVDHDAGAAAIAAGYGVVAHRVEREDDLEACLREPITGRSVIEVPIQRQSRAGIDAALLAELTALS